MFFHEPNTYYFRSPGSRSTEPLFVSDYIHLQDNRKLTPLDEEAGFKTAYNNDSARKYLSLFPAQKYLERFRQTLSVVRSELSITILRAASQNQLDATIKAVQDFEALNPLFPSYKLESPTAVEVVNPCSSTIFQSPEEAAQTSLRQAFAQSSVEKIIQAVHKYELHQAQTESQRLSLHHPASCLCSEPVNIIQKHTPVMSNSRFPGLQTSNLPAVREDHTQATTSPTRDAAKLNMLRRMRPPPFKHAWTFYHDRHSDGADYTNRLTVLLENIISIKPFWEAFNRFPLESLRMKDSVHFFKRGVRPVWEDPRNMRGGSWTFRIPKDKSAQFWKEVLLLAVGEQFADVLAPKDDLCGLSLSTRFNSNLITIWNRDGENQKAIDGILDIVLKGVSQDIKPRDNSYYYKKHSEHIGFEEAVAKARAEADAVAKAKSDQLGKIEEAKVTEQELAEHEEKADKEQEALLEEAVTVKQA